MTAKCTHLWFGISKDEYTQHCSALVFGTAAQAASAQRALVIARKVRHGYKPDALVAMPKADRKTFRLWLRTKYGQPMRVPWHGLHTLIRAL